MIGKSPETAAAIAALVAFVVGFAVGRYRRRRTHTAIQNRGEALVSRELGIRFAAPDYHLLNHVTLRLKGESTQIDHILVSRFGVFVIETKDFSGWIFAASGDRFWTQVLHRSRNWFQNPIRQNYRHVCAVREVLDFLPSDAIRPVVVFTGRAEFKTIPPDGVFSLDGLIGYVSGHRVELMSINRVQFCVGRLETTRLAITNATDVEHIESLRRRYGANEGEVEIGHRRRIEHELDLD